MKGLRWWLLGTLAWCAGVLATNSIAEVPWWDADPLLSDLPETSLTPGQVLLICSVGLISSTGLLVGSVRRGELSRLTSIVFGAVAIAGVGVILHGVLLRPVAAGGSAVSVHGDLESLVTGASWVAGILAGFAVASMKPRDRVLRLVLGAFVVLGALMVAKALFESSVELPRTIAMFQRERDSVLLANGLEPGTAGAEIYERRLRSQQPTAWFGLANVLASFVAAMSLFLLASAVRAVADARTGRCSSGGAGLVVLLFGASALALWLTGSKGAMGVWLMVLVLASIVWRHSRVKGWVQTHPGRAVASVGGLVVVGVTVRGLLLPESIERSVLFRWHYLIGTLRVWMENLLIGAGPGGFQDAYTRLKPPISPENVQSPHALIADWVGAFGLIGLIVVAGLMFWFWRAEPVAATDGHPRERDSGEFRGEFAWCVLVGAAVLTTSLGVQWGVVGGVADLLLVLAIGIGVGGAGLGVLLGVWRRHPTWLAWGAIGIASVLIGHGMFDVAPARAGSAILFWVLVGAGVGPLVGTPLPRGRGLILAAVAGLPLAGAVGWVGVHQVTRIEPLLHASERAVREGDVSSVGLDLLNRASSLGPGWLKLDLVTFRLEVGTAMVRERPDDVLLPSARLSERWSRSVETQSAVCVTLWSLGDGSVAGAEFRRRAADAAALAAGLAPHDAQPAYRAAIMLHEVGRMDDALRWAERSIANSRQGAMDPFAGLREEQFLRLRRKFPELFSDGRATAGEAAGGG